MNRDFETEYKDYVSQDLPDLWSRIEPNLLERDAITEDMASLDVPTSDMAVKIDETKTEENSNVVIPMARFAKRVVPFAAAALVMILCAKMIQSGLFSRGAASSAPCADEAVMESAAADEMVMDTADAAVEMSDAPAEEAASEEAATNTSIAESFADEAPAMTETATADEAADYEEETSDLAGTKSPSKEVAQNNKREDASGVYEKDVPADFGPVVGYDTAHFIDIVEPEANDEIAAAYGYPAVLLFEVEQDEQLILIRAYATMDMLEKIDEKYELAKDNGYLISVAMLEDRKELSETKNALLISLAPR